MVYVKTRCLLKIEKLTYGNVLLYNISFYDICRFIV